MILWFRPEIEQTIRWAGEPTKPSAVDGRLHPRRSFASWQEFVRGRSLRWSASAEAAVLELRQALLGIVLRRAQERAEVAIEVTRVTQELEAFSYTVSHDLRAPMRHIAGYADLVLDTEDKVLSERARRYLGQVKEASAYAGQLVDALLDFSRMGRSALKRSTVPTEMLVDDLVRELAGIETGRPIEWTIERPLRTCTETRSCCRSRSATCSATRSSSRAAAKGTGIGLANVRRIEARLIDDLLDLTAISAGKVSMKRTSVDMHALVRTVAEMVEHDARAKKHRVVLDLSAATPCVEADEARMQQVLWNLVRNAIEFTPNGGEIRITTRSDTAGFVLTYSDSGIGIDAESLPRIFSAFEQAGDEISQRYGGLGLGLAIAKGLVDQMHGSLAAASPGTGQGSTFTLRMPDRHRAARRLRRGRRVGRGRDHPRDRGGASLPPAARRGQHRRRRGDGAVARGLRLRRDPREDEGAGPGARRTQPLRHRADRPRPARRQRHRRRSRAERLGAGSRAERLRHAAGCPRIHDRRLLGSPRETGRPDRRLHDDRKDSGRAITGVIGRREPPYPDATTADCPPTPEPFFLLRAPRARGRDVAPAVVDRERARRNARGAIGARPRRLRTHPPARR